MIEHTVEDLARLVGGELRGDGSLRVRGVGDLRSATVHQICFVRNEQYAAAAATSTAGALLVASPIDAEQPQIVVDNVELAFARIASMFHPEPRARSHSIHPTAVVDESADLEQPVEIGAHVVIGAEARIGAGTVVRSGCTIEGGVSVGRDCVLHPRVVLQREVTLGDRVVVHAGAVIGSDGFGYAADSFASDGRRWSKLPQIGTVTIEDDVEIGANTTIDRATFGATRIGAGAKIDNLVHVGHNCRFGSDVAIAGFSAFSGSTVLGDRVTCAGHVVSAGHLRVCDDVRIGGNSALRGDLTEPGDYLGYPLQKLARWARTLHILDHLVELQDQVKARESKED